MGHGDRNTSDGGEEKKGGTGEPRSGDAQKAPQPVRPETVQEEERVAPRDQEDPPQAEGDRDDVAR